MTPSNPLLEPYNTPFQVPPFQAVEVSYYLPAIEKAMASGREEVAQIARNPAKPTFSNTIEAMEHAGELMDNISSVLFNLNSAETSDELQKVAQDVSPKLTAFNSEIRQNNALFKRIESVYRQRAQLELNKEQEMLLVKTYKNFVRSGAALDEEKKKRFREITIALSQKGLKFGEHVLAETNDFRLVVTDEHELSGLPDDVKDRAKKAAEDSDTEGWVFTLQAPSYIPFMEYADSRHLREKLYKAYMSRSFGNNDNDNSRLVREIVALRAELSQLLGYETYADYVLEERMAENPEEVNSFLDDLLSKAIGAAREEVEEIKAFMKAQGADFELERWDWAYYSEKLRKKKFNFDDEIIKPYFRLEHVIEGVFLTAEKLYGISFKENNDIPVYHEDVRAYEVFSEGKVTAVFLADFFPRKGKKPGAWMTSFREQATQAGERIIPIVSIVCNFTPSSENAPSLLKFDEVKTLFHEFGHALHGMLANTQYKSLSGTNVYWDFVELPSQIFENWCYEKECLDLFAKHYKTGVPIPRDFIVWIKAAANYHEAYATVRQLSFGMLDMAYHHATAEDIGDISDIERFEKQAMSKTELFPDVPDTCMSVQFSHIFAGGYASGYYSYKWAEVLDADAFTAFREKGVFNREVAKSYRDNILSRGGVEHPMDLYKKFRGRAPSTDALMKRAGLSG